MEDSSEIQNPKSAQSDFIPYDSLLSELEWLRNQNRCLSESLKEASEASDSLRIGILEEDFGREEEWLQEKLELEIEIHVCRGWVSELLDERIRRVKSISEVLDSVFLLRECLRKIWERISEEKFVGRLVKGDISEDELLLEMKSVYELAMEVEIKVAECEERREKETKEMVNSIVSLTEENRDVNSLLRAALVEKAAVERNLSKLKSSGDQKRVAILQIAERGLQKVGFGFIMGSMTAESQLDSSSGSSANAKVDEEQSEEEAVSVASTFEMMTKNLRLEIANLKESLEETRLDNEHLQGLAHKQTQKISESTLYIKNLEERETMLSHKVEELMIEVAEAEEDAARWREACELEVEAGKVAIRGSEREVAMLKEELGMLRTALDASNNKLKMKEKLAASAMAAQEAGEASLCLADRRSAVLRERIEELTRQLQEEVNHGKKEHSGSWRRVRHVCWPWQVLRFTPTAAMPRTRNFSRRKQLPEMEALLHVHL